MLISLIWMDPAPVIGAAEQKLSVPSEDRSGGRYAPAAEAAGAVVWGCQLWLAEWPDGMEDEGAAMLKDQFDVLLPLDVARGKVTDCPVADMGIWEGMTMCEGTLISDMDGGRKVWVEGVTMPEEPLISDMDGGRKVWVEGKGPSCMESWCLTDC
ncbi:hypothetical protein FRB94_003035 [Tulasnella sp. JGI-2019a]|nr:hypothetical protein FRB94_003035 [Tulasnella sp. JGI-2019a]